MVDFNNETTIGRPAVDIERVSVLQRRYEYIEALEDYNKHKFMNARKDTSIIRARLVSLFLELQGTIKRHLKEKEYNELYTNIFNAKDFEINLQSFLIINEFIDDKLKITRLDTQKYYDASNVEEENKEKGY